MSISVEELVEVLWNGYNDNSRIKILKTLAKYIKINTTEEMKTIVQTFTDKTKAFNCLYTENKLSDVQIEHLQFFGFLSDTKILNEATEMNTLKSIVSLSPNMIVDVLNFIRRLDKTDDQRLELIKVASGSSEIFSKLIENVGHEEFAKLLSVYFIDYNKYVECCKYFNVDESYCEKFKESIEIENDTITIFEDNKIRFSEMPLENWFHFEKTIGDNLMIYNLKKRCGKSIDSISTERIIMNPKTNAVSANNSLTLFFKGKGMIANEHSYFVSSK